MAPQLLNEITQTVIKAVLDYFYYNYEFLKPEKLLYIYIYIYFFFNIAHIPLEYTVIITIAID